MNSNSSGNFITRIPPVTRHLIIINLLIWLAETCLPTLGEKIVRYGGLHYFAASDFNPVQLVTRMFVHTPRTLTHVFFNMFSLWMFGNLLERVWGSKRFLIYYFACGIGAALVQEGVWALTWEHDFIQGLARENGKTYEYVAEALRTATGDNAAKYAAWQAQYINNFITIGASGAVFGILLGFAFVFPNLPMYLFFIPIPIKAKYMVAGYAVLEFFLGVANFGGDNVAHFAHLGGLIFGLVILLIWKHQGKLGGGTFY